MLGFFGGVVVGALLFYATLGLKKFEDLPRSLQAKATSYILSRFIDYLAYASEKPSLAQSKARDFFTVCNLPLEALRADFAPGLSLERAMNTVIKKVVGR